jgi:hypothetical protein
MHRAVVAVAATLAAAIVAAGCGGSDDDAKADRAYIAQVNTTVKRFAKQASGVPAGFTQDSLHTYSATLDRTADALRRIQPPTAVAKLHDQLAGDVASYAQAIEQAASTPLSKDPQKLVAAQQDLLAATATANREVNRTLQAIGRTLDAQD